MNIIKTSEKIGDNACLNFKDLPILDIRRNSIPEICKGKRVLVIGCVDMIDIISLKEYIAQGKHQFHNIVQEASYTAGIDINLAGVKELKNNNYNVAYCDISSETCSYLDQEYDYVVLSHVIEHVIDLTGFIKKIVASVKAKEFIFAVPNAYNIKHALPCLLFQRERVSNDHYYTFTPITFIKLIQGLNFKVCSVYLDQDRSIVKGRSKVILGLLWSFIKSKVFKHSGDIILIAKVIK